METYRLKLLVERLNRAKTPEDEQKALLDLKRFWYDYPEYFEEVKGR